MLKTLIRKNMTELGTVYFRDKKQGGKKHGGALIGMIILYVFVFLLLAGSFAGLAALFFSSTDSENTWIAWAVMGTLAVVMSTIINAITSYSQLYLAKDNEMLLSMPIHPGDIVKSRMIIVYITGFMYIAIAWIPAMIVGGVMHKTTVISMILAFVMMFVISFAVLALTCLIGWLIALLATKLKNQKTLVAVFGLVFIGGIYYLQIRTNSLLNRIVEDMDRTADVLKSSLYPFYMMGRGICGNVPGLIVSILIVALLMTAAYLLLSRTFIKVTTAKQAGGKAEFKESQIKTSSVKKALMKKEQKRFFGSATYMLNSGLGAVMMVIVAVLLFIKKDVIYGTAGQLLEIPFFADIIPLAILLVICLMESLATSSAASISMEGKMIWVLQTLPVSAKDVLNAKMQFSGNMQSIPGALMTLAICYALGLDSNTMAVLLAFSLFFGQFSSALGIYMNLKHPNLDWTSETTPIKQGLPVAAVLFGGWGIGVALAAIGYFARNLIKMDIYIALICVVLDVLYVLISKWIKNTGAQIFAHL